MKDWARNDVTMERVGQSVLAYSFHKDGQSKGERVDEATSLVAAGQTYKFRLHSFMFEEKKTQPSVFPQDLDVIPAFSVVEVMISPSNMKQFEEGWGIGLTQVRPCSFSLYSIQHPLGLGLLPQSYEESVRQADGHVQTNSGLRKILEDKNTGFFGRVVPGSYFIRYNEDFRLVGPKEDPNDQQSKHRNVMDGGVFAIDISREELLRFTNSGESEEEDGLVHATFLVELAAAAGVLDCYVTYNEYLLRHDPNRSPFTGVPLIDSQRLLEFIKTEDISGAAGQRFYLPFDFFPMDRPYLELTPIPESSETVGETPRPCADFSLASENTSVAGARSYKLSLGDATEEDIRCFLFVPKTSATGGGHMLQGRQDYRMLKKRKASDVGSD